MEKVVVKLFEQRICGAPLLLMPLAHLRPLTWINITSVLVTGELGAFFLAFHWGAHTWLLDYAQADVVAHLQTIVVSFRWGRAKRRAPDEVTRALEEWDGCWSSLGRLEAIDLGIGMCRLKCACGPTRLLLRLLVHINPWTAIGDKDDDTSILFFFEFVVHNSIVGGALLIDWGAEELVKVFRRSHRIRDAFQNRFNSVTKREHVQGKHVFLKNDTVENPTKCMLLTIHFTLVDGP